MLPDIPAVDRTFDYAVPEAMDGDVRAGTIVRVPFGGRRVRAWVLERASAPATDHALKPLARVTGMGPQRDVLALAEWAAWRWAGRPATFLRAASPPGVVRGLPARPQWRPASADTEPALVDAFEGPGAVVRLPPTAPLAAVLAPLVARAAGRAALVLAPTLAQAAQAARELRRLGASVAFGPQEWARAAAGGSIVVGARAAAWMPAPDLAAVVVLDEHEESYQGERTPTWNGRDVAVERARRAGVPCALVSPCPSLEALERFPLRTLARDDERAGWPAVEVVDRREAPPGEGLFSPRVAAVVREAHRVVCVLNRKGRARLLACGACGELARCERCAAAVSQGGDGLRCDRCGEDRPLVCANCGGQRLRVLRIGVSKAREELEALVRRPVAEVTADHDDRGDDAAVVVGTEAVLYRAARADAVVFLDFDQELLAPRYRAAEESLGLLARAARLVGGRAGRVVLQTRVPGHEVIDAATHADPGRLALLESARRAALGFPPHAALAAVSGEAAGEFVAGLAVIAPTLDVAGPVGGRYLIRAGSHEGLCDALAAARRPSGRLRLEVDPLRV